MFWKTTMTQKRLADAEKHQQTGKSVGPKVRKRLFHGAFWCKTQGDMTHIVPCFASNRMMICRKTSAHGCRTLQQNTQTTDTQRLAQASHFCRFFGQRGSCSPPRECQRSDCKVKFDFFQPPFDINHPFLAGFHFFFVPLQLQYMRKHVAPIQNAMKKWQ